jgi:hypothetical protein
MLLLVLPSPDRCSLASAHVVSRQLAARWSRRGKTSQTSASRSRFLACRLEGLSEEPRPCGLRVIGDERIEQVITATFERTPGQDTHRITR